MVDLAPQIGTHVVGKRKVGNEFHDFLIKTSQHLLFKQLEGTTQKP